jgi:putative ABC transport system permease protein
VDIRHDLGMAARRIARRPGLAASVTLILTLGIGVATAVFSVAHRLLVRPLPVPDPDRLIVAWETDPGRTDSLIEVSYPHFLDWRAGSRSFQDMAAFGSVNWSLQLRGSFGVETVPYAAVSGSFFDTLAARPLLGRTFLPHEDGKGAPRVAVVGYALWQRRFAGDPAVVGSTVHLSGEPFTVIGVMPRDFDFPRGAQVWRGVGRELAALHERESHSPQFQRGLGVLYVLGRLKEGVSREAARTELGTLARRISVADHFSQAGWDARLVPLVDHYLGPATRRALEALAVASAIVLLLACANVAVILLVEAIGRRNDLAVRRALGAGGLRLVLDPLAQGSLLAVAGGLGGTMLAAATVRAVVAFAPGDLPGLAEVALDGRALAFAAAVTVATALLIVVAPSWLSSRLAIAPTLKAGGPGGGSDPRGWRISRLLVTAEVALSAVLLVGGGLMVRSLGNLLRVDLGFVPDRALTFSVTTARDFEGRTFQRTLLERLTALPGVEAAGAVHNLPLALGLIGSDNWVVPEGLGTDEDAVRERALVANWELVTPDYFRAIGTRLLAGRAFTDHDGPDAPKVVIVSESVARRLWPGADPLHRRLNTWGAKWDPKNGIYEWQTVVGVVEDARYRGIQHPRPDVYLPYEQAPGGIGHFVVRTKGRPMALAGAVREQVAAIDSAANVEGLTTIRTLVERALAPWRFTSALLAVFAAVALVLTASGLFGVLHHFVSRRTREIAIRMALGAEPRRVRRFILRQGLTVTAAGLALGLGLSLALVRALSALLYGVDARDPWTYLAGTAALGAVAALACSLPARRAAAVDPAVALRSE